MAAHNLGLAHKGKQKLGLGHLLLGDKLLLCMPLWVMPLPL